jgi:phage terminase small subunit
MGDLKTIPAAPGTLNQVAADFWKKKCHDLKDMGKLSTCVLESLEAYCNHLADMQKAREMMSNAWGEEVFFRYQKAYIEANKQQIALAREFGFTPVSSKKFPQGKKKKNPVEGLD